jgi:hypothetical protein
MAKVYAFLAAISRFIRVKNKTIKNPSTIRRRDNCQRFIVIDVGGSRILIQIIKWIMGKKKDP